MAENDIHAIVRTANNSWNAAFNRGDAVAVAALYTTDGTVLPHTHAVVKGTEAITQFWSGMITAGIKDHDIELLDAHEVGDIAYSNGKWRAIGVGVDGKQQVFEGLIVTILRRQRDGSWRTCLHTWN
jgi:uncharacterized protein (TIGR02246 family)